LIKESQVVIHVENLCTEEREQILYNHIKLGAQSTDFKRDIKPFLKEVAAHVRFSPEIARRLGNSMFTKHLIVSKGGLDDFVAHPLELLCEIIRTIDPNSRAALALVFMRVGTLPSPVEMTIEEHHAITLLGGSAGGVRTALNALKGSLLIQSFQKDSYVWQYKHPTIRDAFASLVSEDTELLDIYLTGTPAEKLFEEVSCGDVGIEGVKVIVSSDRFEALMNRMDTLGSKKQESKRTLHRFLTHRCNKEFLTRYIRRNPRFIEDLRVGSYLYAVSDVDVIVRLHEFGLLPEQKRLDVIGTIRELAVDTPDSGFLQRGIRDIFTEDEFNEILEHVRSILLPNLDDQIQSWRLNYNGEDAPDGYFAELKWALENFRDEFADSENAATYITAALMEIEEVIEELRSEPPEEPDSEDYYGRSSSDRERDDTRSIFDDVDQ